MCGACKRTLSTDDADSPDFRIFSVADKGGRAIRFLKAGLRRGGVLALFAFVGFALLVARHAGLPRGEQSEASSSFAGLDLSAYEDVISGMKESANANAKNELTFDDIPHEFKRGLYKINTYKSRVAPLTVVTAPGKKYYVKLMSVETGVTEIEALVEGGAPLSFDVPLGVYRLKYAAGDVWYGDIDLFRESTVTSVADKALYFSETMDGVSGYTVQLILQNNGNLKTKGISRAEFAK